MESNNFISGAARLVSNSGKQPVNQIWFAWSAPSGSTFGQPHVQWVALDRSNNFTLVAQHQIWNNAYAFAYPAIAVNANGTVGLSLAYGGKGQDAEPRTRASGASTSCTSRRRAAPAPRVQGTT